MTVNSMFSTYGSMTKHVFTSMVLSTMRTRELVKRKLSHCLTFISAFTKSNGMDCSFLERNNRATFLEQPINAERYLGILEEFVGIHTKLGNRSNDSWFMQDDVCRHRMSAVIDFL